MALSLNVILDIMFMITDTEFISPWHVSNGSSICEICVVTLCRVRSCAKWKLAYIEPNMSMRTLKYRWTKVNLNRASNPLIDHIRRSTKCVHIHEIMMRIKHSTKRLEWTLESIDVSWVKTIHTIWVQCHQPRRNLRRLYHTQHWIISYLLGISDYLHG